MSLQVHACLSTGLPRQLLEYHSFTYPLLLKSDWLQGGRAGMCMRKLKHFGALEVIPPIKSEFYTFKIEGRFPSSIVRLSWLRFLVVILAVPNSLPNQTSRSLTADQREQYWARWHNPQCHTARSNRDAVNTIALNCPNPSCSWWLHTLCPQSPQARRFIMMM